MHLCKSLNVKNAEKLYPNQPYPYSALISSFVPRCTATHINRLREELKLSVKHRFNILTWIPKAEELSNLLQAIVS